MYNKTVLLVDDEKPVLLSLGSLLKRHSCSVQSVTSGEDALARFRSTSFDLVITDIVMEGMNGIEVLQEIKKINSETGVFLLTGYGNLQLAIDAIRAGADDFFLKPCDTEELLLKMNLFFEKQDALRKIKIYDKHLPICVYCKKIRDDSGTEIGEGKWMQIEEYLCRKSGSGLTHGCCPECFSGIMAEMETVK